LLVTFVGTRNLNKPTDLRKFKILAKRYKQTRRQISRNLLQ